MASTQVFDDESSGAPQQSQEKLQKKRPSLRSSTSFIYNSKEHLFSVVLPEDPVWKQTLNKVFTGALREESYVQETKKVLNQRGFESYNTLSCVSVCRDELCFPFVDMIDEEWTTPYLDLVEGSTHHTVCRGSFNMSSLGGMLFLGKTGFNAAISHAPIEKGRQRFVFYVMPHIGVDDEGNIGKIDRPGQHAKSSSCGALVAFQKELENGFVNLESDADDLEYILLKQKLIKKIKLFGEEAPTLEQLILLAQQTIVEDLEHLIKHVIDAEKSDYAVLSAIQIHVPGGITFILPKEMYTVIEGQKLPITLSARREKAKSQPQQ